MWELAFGTVDAGRITNVANTFPLGYYGLQNTDRIISQLPVLDIVT